MQEPHGNASLANSSDGKQGSAGFGGNGDMIRVRQAGKAFTVRLACIDAPETAQGPYGQQSRNYLQQRLPVGREVSLEVKTTDRYGRSVAEVISEININLAMVEDGQAFAYRQYLSGCDAKEYLDAEYRASRRRYGVWQVEGGITRPWAFRRGRRSALTPRPCSCCGKGTPTSMAMPTGKPAHRCADRVASGTGIGTPASHHRRTEGLL